MATFSHCNGGHISATAWGCLSPLYSLGGLLSSRTAIIGPTSVGGHPQVPSPPPTFRPQVFVQGPHNFPFLNVSSAHRRFLGLLAVQSIVGLRPTGLQAQSLPSFETKERAWSRRQRGQTYTSEARSWRDSSQCVAEACGQYPAAGFGPPREGKGTTCRRKWYLIGSLVTSEARGGPPPLTTP